MKLGTMEYPESPRVGRSGVTRRIGWTYGKNAGPLLSLSAETPTEESALRVVFEVLRAVLPQRAVRLDELPILEPDGHGDVYQAGVSVSLQIFSKSIE